MAGIIIAVTGETVVFFIDAASFLGVIAVMAYLSSRTGSALSSRTGSALSSRTGSALSSRTGSAPHHAAAPAAAGVVDMYRGGGVPQPDAALATVPR